MDKSMQVHAVVESWGDKFSPTLQLWQQQQVSVVQVCTTKNALKDYNYCFDSLAIRLRSKDLKHLIPRI